MLSRVPQALFDNATHYLIMFFLNCENLQIARLSPTTLLLSRFLSHQTWDVYPLITSETVTQIIACMSVCMYCVQTINVCKYTYART